MALLQQLMQVATQPSPVKAIFTEADVELASVVLLQHLIASCRNTTVSSHRPADSTCPPPTTDPDDVERHARGAANSDTAALMGNYDTHLSYTQTKLPQQCLSTGTSIKLMLVDV